MSEDAALDFGVLATLSELHWSPNLALTGRALGRSRATVRTRVKKLEKALGVPLYRRVGNELHLTEAGKALAEYGWRSVVEGKSLVEHLRREVTWPLRVALAIDSALLRHVFAPAVERFVAVHQGPFVVHERAGASAVQLVREGEVDIAVGVLDDAPDDLESRVLGRFPYLAVARGEHPIFRTKHPSISDLAGDKLVVTESAAARVGVAPTRVVCGDMAIKLAEVGVGVAIVESFHHPTGKVHTTRLRDVAPAVVRIVHGRAVLIDLASGLREELLRQPVQSIATTRAMPA